MRKVSKTMLDVMEQRTPRSSRGTGLLIVTTGALVVSFLI